ncbi:MAG TPA: hypothetical protein VE007_06335 [Thermoanaerobaculia bacterium]|nr:hypothetical protein [Thermoanaerobaculia bacterium]
MTALPEERRPILHCMSRARALTGAGFRAWAGELGGRKIVLAETGAGARAAGAAAGELFARFAPERWVGAGFTGALSHGIAFGSIVVPVELAGALAPALDAAMSRRAIDLAPGVHPVRAATSAAIAASSSEKSRLLSAAGGSLPVVVDMESAAWAGAAGGIPGVLVRVVTDAAEDEIPDFIAASVSAGGAVDRGRIVRHALRHPSSIGKLLDLRRRAKFCGERLAGFLETFASRGF